MYVLRERKRDGKRESERERERERVREREREKNKSQEYMLSLEKQKGRARDMRNSRVGTLLFRKEGKPASLSFYKKQTTFVFK